MSDIEVDINTALPDHTILADDLKVPDKPIPITAIVNGKKVVVGHGTLDPETGMFSGDFEEGNANADILRGKLQGSVDTFLHVSEAQLSMASPNEVKINDSVKSIIRSFNPAKDPSPKFHNHD